MERAIFALEVRIVVQTIIGVTLEKGIATATQIVKKGWNVVQTTVENAKKGLQNTVAFGTIGTTAATILLKLSA